MMRDRYARSAPAGFAARVPSVARNSSFRRSTSCACASWLVVLAAAAASARSRSAIRCTSSACDSPRAQRLPPAAALEQQQAADQRQLEGSRVPPTTSRSDKSPRRSPVETEPGCRAAAAPRRCPSAAAAASRTSERSAPPAGRCPRGSHPRGCGGPCARRSSPPLRGCRRGRRRRRRAGTSCRGRRPARRSCARSRWRCRWETPGVGLVVRIVRDDEQHQPVGAQVRGPGQRLRQRPIDEVGQLGRRCSPRAVDAARREEAVTRRGRADDHDLGGRGVKAERRSRACGARRTRPGCRPGAGRRWWPRDEIQARRYGRPGRPRKGRGRCPTRNRLVRSIATIASMATPAYLRRR